MNGSLEYFQKPDHQIVRLMIHHKLIKKAHLMTKNKNQLFKEKFLLHRANIKILKKVDIQNDFYYL
jgi:hypothetical protein